MSEKIIHFNDIGRITFRKNKRSRNVSIAIRPLKGVIVTIPYYLSYKHAINIVERKKEWILKQLPKIEHIENKATVFTENTVFNTKYRKLEIFKNYDNNIKSKITPESISISYPENLDVKTPAVQEIIKSVIIEVLRKEAKEFLPERTLQLADKYGFKFKKVFIKNNTSLWGSCSSVNNINLNLHLLRLPDYLIDYVIIHELCHTVEKNHGKGFWNLMDSILGDAKLISKELKNYSLRIY
jgi:predicted metal-dependent hydrolase